MPLRNPLEKDDLTEMSAIGAKLISAQSPLRGPGCVKTCTSRECAELFSLFSSFDGDCQSGSFLFNVIETDFLRASPTSEFSHSLGPQARTSQPCCGISVLPPTTDIERPRRHVRFVLNRHWRPGNSGLWRSCRSG